MHEVSEPCGGPERPNAGNDFFKASKLQTAAAFRLVLSCSAACGSPVLSVRDNVEHSLTTRM